MREQVLKYQSEKVCYTDICGNETRNSVTSASGHPKSCILALNLILQCSLNLLADCGQKYQQSNYFFFLITKGLCSIYLKESEIYSWRGYKRESRLLVENYHFTRRKLSQLF